MIGDERNARESVYCEKCGEKMIIDKKDALLTNPPRYKAECPNCGRLKYIL